MKHSIEELIIWDMAEIKDYADRPVPLWAKVGVVCLIAVVVGLAFGLLAVVGW